PVTPRVFRPRSCLGRRRRGGLTVNQALLMPLLMLAAVAVVSAWLGLVARDRQRLQRRGEAAVPSGALVHPLRDRAPDLRMRRSGGARIGVLVRLLKVPVDLPQAHLVQPLWIVAGTTVAALGMAWLSHFLLSWALAAAIGVVAWLLLLR